MDVHNPTNLIIMNSTKKLLTTSTTLMGKIAGVFVLSLLIGISQTHATQTVRELFDKIGKPVQATVLALFTKTLGVWTGPFHLTNTTALCWNIARAKTDC